jgi:hypothetical protein
MDQLCAFESWGAHDENPLLAKYFLFRKSSVSPPLLSPPSFNASSDVSSKVSLKNEASSREASSQTMESLEKRLKDLETKLLVTPATPGVRGLQHPEVMRGEIPLGTNNKNVT